MLRARSWVSVLLAVSVVPAVAPSSAAARPPSPVRPASESATSPSVAASPLAAATIRVGSLDLTPCDVTERALCGTLPRAWDPTGAVPGTIGVGFAFVPAADATRRAVGTVVPHEGGPGYSTTGSAGSYAAMYGPLLQRRNMLLVDQRGTGRSQPVDCPELQDLVIAYDKAAARCAARLGPRAHLYGTALSADDLSAVVRALGLDDVDVYGDSYGTFFTQVFAARHPAQVRSLVLDSAYPTYGENAWYATQGPAMRTSFDSVCRRTPACARLGARTTTRMSALLTQIRRKPISGKVYGGDGKRHSVTLDPSALSYLAFNATYGPVTYRELDAAMRAWLLRRDSAPLLRILAEVYYPGGGTSDPVDYSEGLDAAVSCQDYPQLYDMTQTPAVRRQQYAAAIKRRVANNPNTYGPFRIREYLASDWATQSWCLQWPTAPAAYRQGPIRPPNGRYPASVPVLVLSGELDSITTPAEGAQVARQWPRSRHVVVANSFHVTAYGDVDTCAVTILRSFVTTARLPGAKVRRCAAVVPPVRATPAFRTSSADAPAARALPGSTTSQTRLSAVTTTAETVADLLDRWFQTYEVGGVGLRGGEWVSRGSDVVKFDLDRFRLVNDLAVSGTVRWNRYSHKVTVDLRTFGTTAAGRTIRGSWRNGTLAGSWDGRASGARAVLTGRLGGEPVRAWTPAP